MFAGYPRYAWHAVADPVGRLLRRGTPAGRPSKPAAPRQRRVRYRPPKRASKAGATRVRDNDTRWAFPTVLLRPSRSLRKAIAEAKGEAGADPMERVVDALHHLYRDQAEVDASLDKQSSTLLGQLTNARRRLADLSRQSETLRTAGATAEPDRGHLVDISAHFDDYPQLTERLPSTYFWWEEDKCSKASTVRSGAT